MNNHSDLLTYISSEYATGMAGRPDWAIKLVNRRLELGLKQEQIVERSGDILNQSRVSKLENGTVHPTENLKTEEFFSLLEALNWTLEQFTAATGINVASVVMRYALGADVIRTAPIHTAIVVNGTFLEGSEQGAITLSPEYQGIYKAFKLDNFYKMWEAGTTIVCQITTNLSMKDMLLLKNGDNYEIMRVRPSTEEETQALMTTRNPIQALIPKGFNAIGKVTDVKL